MASSPDSVPETFESELKRIGEYHPSKIGEFRLLTGLLADLIFSRQAGQKNSFLSVYRRPLDVQGRYEAFFQGSTLDEVEEGVSVRFPFSRAPIMSVFRAMHALVPEGAQLYSSRVLFDGIYLSRRLHLYSPMWHLDYPAADTCSFRILLRLGDGCKKAAVAKGRFPAIGDQGSTSPRMYYGDFQYDLAENGEVIQLDGTTVHSHWNDDTRSQGWSCLFTQDYRAAT